MTGFSSDVLERVIADPVFFAAEVLGEAPWPHQVEVLRSGARYRVLNCGRRSGKSRTMAIECLHVAVTRPGSRVIIVSAGEVAARRLLAECSALARAPMVRSSVVDDDVSLLSFRNGSEIRAVPASQKQIRGWGADLWVCDEFAFLDPNLWYAGEPVILDRPGSRVILASTPWGTPQHPFRVLFELGMSGADPTVAAWHWPSTVSPRVDSELLEQIRRRTPPLIFAREYLAEFTEAGAYFTQAELADSVAPYRMIRPEDADGQLVVGGVDWGFANDANTLCFLGVLDDAGLDQPAGDEPTFFVAHIEEHFGMKYATFIERVVASVRAPSFDDGLGGVREPRAVGPSGFHAAALVSETNGVGQFPTEHLTERLHATGAQAFVAPVHTDVKRKEGAFGAIKHLLQQGRLVLPDHPALLRQLGALSFEQTEHGNTRIYVEEALGHDDLALALAQSVSAVRPVVGRRPDTCRGRGDLLRTAGGTWIHENPRCAYLPDAFTSPRGRDKWQTGW